MAFVTVEDRVEWLEAMFGQFMAELALLNKQAKDRDKAAEERNIAAEERNRLAEERNRLAEERNQAAEKRNLAAEERNRLAEERMSRFEQEMREFKAEMRQSKRALDKKWGDLANKMGTIIEDILAPNLRRLAREHFGFETILAFMTRCTRRRADRLAEESEFDTLVVGPQAVILGEAKSSPTLEHADAFAEKVGTFFTFFPEYEARRLIPVLGSWAIPDRVVERLTTHRIYALRMGEETMELANAAALEAERVG